MTTNLFSGWGGSGYDKPEDRLTHTLAWALEQDGRALSGLAGFGGRRGRPRRDLVVHPRRRGQGGAPDLSVSDDQGQLVAIIEVKINAPPTAHQATGYATFLRKQAAGRTVGRIQIAPAAYKHDLPGFRRTALEDVPALFRGVVAQVVQHAVDELLGGALAVTNLDREYGVWTNDRYWFLKSLQQALRAHRDCRDHRFGRVAPTKGRSTYGRWYGFHVTGRGNREVWLGFAQGAPKSAAHLVLELPDEIELPDFGRSLTLEGARCVVPPIALSRGTVWARSVADVVAPAIAGCMRR